MGARDDTAIMLARQILGIEDYERQASRIPREVSHASAEVEIRLQSMVRGITQRVWLDQAAIATQVEAQIREAASQVSIDRAIADAVKNELERARNWITDRVRDRISKIVDQAIDERLGNIPKLLAKKVTDKMLGALYDVGYPRGSNIYGRRSAPRRKK